MFKLKIALIVVNAVASSAGGPVDSMVWSDSTKATFEDKDVLEQIDLKLQNKKIELSNEEKDLFDLNAYLSTTFDREIIGSKYYRVINKWTPLTISSKQGRSYFQEMMNSRFRSISDLNNVESKMILIQEKIFNAIEKQLKLEISKLPKEQQQEFERATFEINFSFGFLKGDRIDVIAYLSNGTHRGWDYIKINL